MIEHCSKCGRQRPDYFADPYCPSGNGYCKWVFGSRPCPKFTLNNHTTFKAQSFRRLVGPSSARCMLDDHN